MKYAVRFFVVYPKKNAPEVRGVENPVTEPVT